ncbi:MAG: NAD kinase [Nitrosomonadales bacterium]|nr:NAD kinase [Nitrosomonadales bacterium]
MKHPFQTVALIGKYKSQEITGSLLRLGEFLVARGLSVVVDELTAEHLPAHPYRILPLDGMGGTVDLAIVLGGDGTMLNIARTLAPRGIPLVGVNQGRLGFLTDVSLDTMQQTLAAILDGQFVTDERLLLASRVLRDGVEVFQSLAFNEVVVHRGNLSNMIEFEVRIDGDYLYTQRADGLIVASPTGSTAYALSAGGAIIHPGLDVIELVPINPHTLSNRPIVVKSSAQIEILMHRSKTVRTHFDSHTEFYLELHDQLLVTRFPTPATLLHPVGHSYYRTLREKLLWNQTL